MSFNNNYSDTQTVWNACFGLTFLARAMFLMLKQNGQVCWRNVILKRKENATSRAEHKAERKNFKHNTGIFLTKVGTVVKKPTKVIAWFTFDSQFETALTQMGTECLV